MDDCDVKRGENRTLPAGGVEGLPHLGIPTEEGVRSSGLFKDSNKKTYFVTSAHYFLADAACHV